MVSDTDPESIDGRIDALLDFWFGGYLVDADRLNLLKKLWFSATPDQDAELRERFGGLSEAAARGELDAWAETPRGRLALIVLLDQLPRSLHRGKRDAFAQDARALELCHEGLELGIDAALAPLERVFFCMPLQHAESRVIQALAVETFGKLAETETEKPIATALGNAADFALQHRAIIDRFGRFPHRNEALGRETTEAEREFLASGGSTFGQ
ncbi:MAG TPA: DUF924 family protein [Gammaproteobacteria bacterium]|nr:DUF924 family protein [Gammaproteobacteria bacterium]